MRPQFFMQLHKDFSCIDEEQQQKSEEAIVVVNTMLAANKTRKQLRCKLAASLWFAAAAATTVPLHCEAWAPSSLSSSLPSSLSLSTVFEHPASTTLEKQSPHSAYYDMEVFLDGPSGRPFDRIKIVPDTDHVDQHGQPFTPVSVMSLSPSTSLDFCLPNQQLQLQMSASASAHTTKSKIGQKIPSMFVQPQSTSQIYKTLQSIHKQGIPPRGIQDDQKEQNPKRILGFDISSSSLNVARDITDPNDSSPPSTVAKNDRKTKKAAKLNKELVWASSTSWKSGSKPFFMDTSSRPTSKISESSCIPAWFPWIPTKSQIESLSEEELRQACEQRGIVTGGKKKELEQKLWTWSSKQQHLHRLRLEKAPLINETTETEGLLKVDSLAEWVRTVNLEPLLKRRQEILQDKKRTLKPRKPRNHKKQKARRTKEQNIASLTKAFQKSSSASNFQVKELYIASKEADQIGDRKAAIDILETLLTVTPHDGRVYRRLARMYKENGNIHGARAILRKGLRHNPDNGYLWQGMGQLELGLGFVENAKKILQKATEVDPTVPNPYHSLGIIEHNQGNIANAIKILKQGIEYCPTNHRLHHALGDLYREAQQYDDAKRSYGNALAHAPDVSKCFTYTSMSFVAYDEGDINTCRYWLRKALTMNRGRHAQGWLELAQLEESLGHIDGARAVCNLAISTYEKSLFSLQKHYENRANNRRKIKENKGRQIYKTQEDILSNIPNFRSGDRFFEVYRHWARLEERFGNPKTVDEVYRRASLAFPGWKFAMDWALYYAAKNNYGRARVLFIEACAKASNKHADPYRMYAEFEMSLGNYKFAQSILFRGAQKMSESGDGGLRNRGRQAQLYHTWAMCEWKLQNIERASVLFDHALQLVNEGDDGSKQRAFIFYSMALLEHERDEHHLAQHYLGLCLKENSLPGGNKRVWMLWAKIADIMKDERLKKECEKQVAAADDEFLDDNDVKTALVAIQRPAGRSASASTAMKQTEVQQFLRKSPWNIKLASSPNRYRENKKLHFNRFEMPSIETKSTKNDDNESNSTAENYENNDMTTVDDTDCDATANWQVQRKEINIGDDIFEAFNLFRGIGF